MKALLMSDDNAKLSGPGFTKGVDVSAIPEVDMLLAAFAWRAIFARQ